MIPHYQIYGQGLPVVFIHGFCEDSHMWEHWKKRLSGCLVIRIDLPGFGQTPLDKAYSIDAMAELVDRVLDQAGITQCIMIGHSMGGYVSLAFAEKKPEKLFGLGLIHSHPYADTDETKAARLKRKQFVEKNGAEAYVKQLIPSLFAPENINNQQPTIDSLIARASKYSAQGILNALQAMHDRPDRSDILKKSTIPILFLIGKKDQAIPEPFSMNQLGLPEIASIHIHEDVGHMGMFEAPELCLAQVKSFIKLCRSFA